MEVLIPDVPVCDVHARTVTACVCVASGPHMTHQHCTVPTTTRAACSSSRTG
jgi:hypothetical protein